MSHRIVQTVVFSDSVDGGNPCPVVLDADDLSGEDMQGLAAEQGHETAFVLEPREGGDLRLRYFVPRHEMEMCVHATVATVVLLAREGRAASVVETPLGAHRAMVQPEAGRAMIEQSKPIFGPPLEDASRVLEVLGAEALAGPGRAASTARAKLLVPLDSESVLDGLRPDHHALWSLCDELDVTGFYRYTRDAERADAAARQFPRDAGYDEDPATGVAARALGAHLTAQAGADAWITWTIAQGRAMGRPSIITAESCADTGTSQRRASAARCASSPAADTSDAAPAGAPSTPATSGRGSMPLGGARTAARLVGDCSQFVDQRHVARAVATLSLPRRTSAPQQGAALSRRPADRGRDRRRDARGQRRPSRLPAARSGRGALARRPARRRGAVARRARPRPRPQARLTARAQRQGRSPPRDRHGRLGLGAAAPWLAARLELPVGPLFCVIDGPTRGRPWSSANARRRVPPARRPSGYPAPLRAAPASPRPCRRARARGVPLNVIQRQLDHANLGTTSIYLQGIDTEEIIATVHARRVPMMSATAGLQL